MTFDAVGDDEILLMSFAPNKLLARLKSKMTIYIFFFIWARLFPPSKMDSVN